MPVSNITDDAAQYNATPSAMVSDLVTKKVVGDFSTLYPNTKSASPLVGAIKDSSIDDYEVTDKNNWLKFIGCYNPTTNTSYNMPLVTSKFVMLDTYIANSIYLLSATIYIPTFSNVDVGPNAGSGWGYTNSSITLTQLTSPDAIDIGLYNSAGTKVMGTTKDITSLGNGKFVYTIQCSCANTLNSLYLGIKLNRVQAAGTGTLFYIQKGSIILHNYETVDTSAYTTHIGGGGAISKFTVTLPSTAAVNQISLTPFGDKPLCVDCIRYETNPDAMSEEVKYIIAPGNTTESTNTMSFVFDEVTAKSLIFYLRQKHYTTNSYIVTEATKTSDDLWNKIIAKEMDISFNSIADSASNSTIDQALIDSYDGWTAYLQNLETYKSQVQTYINQVNAYNQSVASYQNSVSSYNATYGQNAVANISTLGYNLPSWVMQLPGLTNIS